MVKVNCLNPIAKVGMKLLPASFGTTDNFAEAEAVLVRSAAMHELELSDSLLAVARAGAGVNNIPLDKCADKGIVVFNTPGANANGVKEMVVAGMLLAARDIRGGMQWVADNKADENIGKTMEKAKNAFAGSEIQGKKLGVIGLGAIGVLVANAAAHLGMDVERRPVHVDELSTFDEVGECGTAVVITPVHKLVDKPFLESEEETIYTYGDGLCGPKSLRLYNFITQIQRGEIEDIFGWNVEV